jgi:integration host factor subunit beta
MFEGGPDHLSVFDEADDPHGPPAPPRHCRLPSETIVSKFLKQEISHWIYRLFSAIYQKNLGRINPMNKSDLIAALAAKEKLTDKQASDIINLIFNRFTETLKKGNRIEIRGFGSYCVREYKGYKGRNPKTKINIDVKPKKLPFFKVGRELKGMVNR